MAVNSAFANAFGGAPMVGLLGSWPPDPSQSLQTGLLPTPPGPQPTVGVLGVPGDPASLFSPALDSYQLAGSVHQGDGGLGLMADQLRALRAIRDHIAVTAGWLGQPAGQGGAAPDAVGGSTPAVQPPPPAQIAGGDPTASAMTPVDAGTLKAFDPLSGYTPNRTYTVGDGNDDVTVFGIAKQIYPGAPVAGVGLLTQANRFRSNTAHSPDVFRGQVLSAPLMPADTVSRAALERHGQFVISANDQGLEARREAATQQQQQNSVFADRLQSGENVWTGLPVAGSEARPTQPWVPPWLDLRPTIPVGPPSASAPTVYTFGGHDLVDYPDSAGDHLYQVEGYRSDGTPIVSGGAFLNAPDLAGEARARRFAEWGAATDAARENLVGNAALLAAHGAGADEDTQFKSAALGAAAGDTLLSFGAVGGGAPGFTNAASPKFVAAQSGALEGLSAGPELGGLGGGPAPLDDQSDSSSPEIPKNPDGDISRINGRSPINSKYAGQIYSLDNTGPKLRIKYPDIQTAYPEGVSFISEGFPDFSPYSRINIKSDNLTGGYKHDEKIANTLAGLVETPEGHLWHHHQDGKTMQLMPADLHDAVRHTGGVAVIKEWKRP